MSDAIHVCMKCLDPYIYPASTSWLIMLTWFWTLWTLHFLTLQSYIAHANTLSIKCWQCGPFKIWKDNGSGYMLDNGLGYLVNKLARFRLDRYMLPSAQPDRDETRRDATPDTATTSDSKCILQTDSITRNKKRTITSKGFYLMCLTFRPGPAYLLIASK